MSAIRRFVEHVEPHWPTEDVQGWFGPRRFPANGEDAWTRAFEAARAECCRRFDAWRREEGRVLLTVRTDSASGPFVGQNWVLIEVLHE